MQEKVVFVTGEDDDKISEILKMDGKFVRLFSSNSSLYWPQLVDFCVDTNLFNQNPLEDFLFVSEATSIQNSLMF